MPARKGSFDVPLTRRNIEDWDFRDVSRGSEAADFWRRNYSRVLVVDLLRLQTIRDAIELGYATVSDDGEYMVVLPEWYEQLFRQYVSRMSLRGLFTPTGRRYRRVRMSLWLEWKKYGRVKLRILPSRGEQRAPTPP